MKYFILMAVVVAFAGCSSGVISVDPCEGKTGVKLAFCKVRNR